MLLAGDELGRTQRGNNNAYCHDSELSWLDWEPDERGRRLLAFVRHLVALRNAHPLFRRRTFFHGRGVRDPEVKDISWLHQDGREMNDHDWHQSFARALGVFVSGHGLAERDELGRPVEDDDLLLLLNAHQDEIAFRLPGARDVRWESVVDTSAEDGMPREPQAYVPGALYPLQGRSLALLRYRRTTA
jgi:glycogen operon protein